MDEDIARGGRNVDPKLLEILVCPVTKTTLEYDRERQELISSAARLAFPIRDAARTRWTATDFYEPSGPISPPTNSKPIGRASSAPLTPAWLRPCR